jgi:hypothetical protein
VRCASSVAARSTRRRWWPIAPRAQRAHRLKPLKDLAGKLRHLVHLAPADGVGAEAGHRHVDRNDRCRQREQHPGHPAGREDHRENHGRRQARGDRPPLVVVEVITQPRELFGDRRNGRARAHLLIGGVTQDERGQDRVAGTSFGAAGTRRGQPVCGERAGGPQEAARHHAEDVAR